MPGGCSQGISEGWSYSLTQNEWIGGHSVPSCLELKRSIGQYEAAVVYLCACRLEDQGTLNICTLMRPLFAVCGVFS